MKKQDFIRSCRKDGMREAIFANGILLMSNKFFSAPFSIDYEKYSKFFKSRKKLKKFLRKVWRHK